jgi:hypothetical protein
MPLSKPAINALDLNKKADELEADADALEEQLEHAAGDDDERTRIYYEKIIEKKRASAARLRGIPAGGTRRKGRKGRKSKKTRRSRKTRKSRR